ncbi:Phosphatidylglycerol/phosphatidylinositol transfer protein [Verticillium dahliae VDG1]|nr:Phosphatidylglycerol/phosphatidylinositol transfer protein [Verticillium dahliae VDG1]
MSSLSRFLLPALLLHAPLAAAHSRVANVIINGTSYEGFNAKQPTNPPVLVAWNTTVSDDGWVNYESYAHPDIICHRDAWAGYPESHKGPVLTYLAPCHGFCEDVDKTALEFFLIGARGLVDPDGVAGPYPSAPGLWASDEFIQNNSSWVVRIPETVRPGHYVLRQELVALHYARIDGLGTQHYPQCVNLEIIGEGDEVPEGTPAVELYGKTDPGLVYDVSKEPLSAYLIPGPTLWSGAGDEVQQTMPVITGTAEAIPGGQDAAPGPIARAEPTDACVQ